MASAAHVAAARHAMDEANAALARVRDGIALLGREPLAAQAFRLANESMALQRERAWVIRMQRAGDPGDVAAMPHGDRGRWYPFQIAFILLNLPSLTDLHHADHSDPTQAAGDLLWFPTGGGKTEAYLGLAAYTMVLRGCRA